MTTISFSPGDVASFAVVLFRVAGIMVFAPFYSSGGFPIQVKIMLPLCVALTLGPAVPAAQGIQSMALGGIVLSLLGEVLVGMVLGLTAAFVFSGLQLAGQIMGFQLGFSIVNVIDPQTTVQTSVLAILQNFLGLIFFLMINGHHWFFRAVAESLDYLPVGGIRMSGPIAGEMVRLSSQIFVAGIQIAAPVLAVTMVADVILGIIGRAAPQINILIEGLPVKILVGLGGMSLACYFLPGLLGSYFMQLSQDLLTILRGLV